MKLTDEIKENIKKCARASGYNPKNKIAFIRGKFDVEENRARWEGNTEDNRKKFLDDAWSAINIWYPNKEWYKENLKEQYE